MNVDLICVGAIKEKFFKEAIDEYSKRLSRYINLKVIELKDEKNFKNASIIMNDKIKAVEGDRIISKLKNNTYPISLDISGEKYSSHLFAKKISEWELKACGNISFIIGGSIGLSKEVLDISKEKISFSDMTFPHQLMRVIFLEQLYRAYRIINNEPYHK